MMDENKIGCLLVVEGSELVGILTDWDLKNLKSRILKRKQSNV